MHTQLPKNTVIMVWNADKKNERQPFMLKISEPETTRAVAFASKDLGESLVTKLNIGQPVWLEPAKDIVTAHPECFLSSEIVFFDNKHTINRFVNEANFIPLKKVEKQTITYPCEWSFAIIGSDEGTIRDAVALNFKEQKYLLENSNASANGKYTSLNLHTSVETEAHRNKIYATLKDIAGVKMVL